MSMTIVKSARTTHDVERRITVEPSPRTSGKRESVTLIVQEGTHRARITLNAIEADGLTGAVKAALR